MLLLCSYVNRHDFFESLFFLSPVVACGCAAGVPPEWTNAPGLPSVLNCHSSVLLLASLSICIHQIPRGAAMSCVLKQECSCFVIHPGSYLRATNLSSFTNLPPTSEAWKMVSLHILGMGLLTVHKGVLKSRLHLAWKLWTACAVNSNNIACVCTVVIVILWEGIAGSKTFLTSVTLQTIKHWSQEKS